MTLDTKLRWKTHVKKKRNELDIKYRKMLWPIGRYLCMSNRNNILLYNQILKPVWTYGIQLWGCVKNCHIIIQFKISNRDIHKDLGITGSC